MTIRDSVLFYNFISDLALVFIISVVIHYYYRAILNHLSIYSRIRKLEADIAAMAAENGVVSYSISEKNRMENELKGLHQELNKK